MRLIRNTLLLMFFLLLTWWLSLYFMPLMNKNTLDTEGLGSIQLKDARVKIAYILNNDVWLTYALQSGEDRVRIMSNVVLDKTYQVSESDRFLYAINYEVLDDKEKVIKVGRFYHQGGQKNYADQETDQTYVSTSVYPALENPLDSRIHILNLRGLEHAVKLRLKPSVFEYPVKKIVVRNYQKKKTSARKLDYAWQRMGDERRQTLAKVSVYDADIITEQEKRQLVINQWAPLGPLGVDGEDYFIQKLYVVREVENDVQLNVAAVPSSGMVIYPGRYGMITFPEDKNDLRISWKLFAGTTNESNVSKINMEWWGRPATRHKKWTENLSQGFLNQQVDGGVIRLSADQPIVVRAWLNQQTMDQAIEITPKPAYLRLFSPAGPGLVYKVNHVRGFKTPYRFDIRAFGEQHSVSLNYQLLDKHDRIVKTGGISLSSQLSAYDSVVADVDRWLTEPKHLYFNLPRRISKIRFNAIQGVWVSAFTRPKNLAHTIVDPVQIEDRKSIIPVWFAVRPEKWKSYLLKGHSQLITVQRRAPEIDMQLLAGQYRWEQFLPESLWKGRNILTVLDAVQEFREEALSSRYLAIEQQVNNKLSFTSKLSANSLKPSIIYSRNNSDAAILKIWLDNNLLYNKLVADKNGEVQLPYVKSGDHILRIEINFEHNSNIDNKTRFFINYVNKKSNAFLKRMAISVPKKGLKFNIEKEKKNELLALRVYIPHDVGHSINLKVKINGIDGRSTGHFLDWTVGRRAYQINPIDKQTIPVMLNTDELIGAERLFFIPLGSDIKNNETYQITLQINPIVKAYVVLTRTIPGLYPSRLLYPDIELEETN